MSKRVITDHEEWDEFTWHYGESATHESVKGPDVVSTSRWFNYMEEVVKNKETGKFYLLEWRQGATEMQEEDFGDSEHTVTEVEPREVTTIEYFAVTKD